MKVTRVRAYPELSRIAADRVQAVLVEKPDSKIVFAMGQTPLGLYAELVRRKRQGALDVSQLWAFQLDGYVGVADDDPRSLWTSLNRVLLAPMGVPVEHTVRFHENASDPEADCRRYERAVKEAGGYDLAVLGLGLNGHLGFNEPPSGPGASTRVVTLSQMARASSRAYFPADYAVPTRGMTAGMDLLLAARRIVVLVSGASKQAVLHEMCTGKPTPTVPASYLNSTSAPTEIIADHEALGE